MAPKIIFRNRRDSQTDSDSDFNVEDEIKTDSDWDSCHSVDHENLISEEEGEDDHDHDDVLGPPLLKRQRRRRMLI